MTTCLVKWCTWESLPVRVHAPVLCLFAATLDRLAVMFMGALLLGDDAFLSQDPDVTSETLNEERDTIECELRTLPEAMGSWRASSPASMVLAMTE
eukprot:s2136_g16.t1